MKAVGSKKRVLIVEDEAFIGVALESALSDLGFDVAAPVARLSAALEAARREDIDGAILDLYLGPQRVDAVADALAARGCPFFFMTGHRAPDLPPGHTGRTVLQKPFRLQELLAALGSEFGFEDRGQRGRDPVSRSHHEPRATPTL